MSDLRGFTRSMLHVNLFSQVMKEVGRNPKNEGKKKRSLKVHMLTDVHTETAIFAKISEAKMYNKKFLNQAHGNTTVVVLKER